MRTWIGNPESLDRRERRTSAAGAGHQAGTLTAAYERCRQLHARYGHIYYLATLLLPRWKRRHVHALYGFTRYADELVDDLAAGLAPAEQTAGLQDWGDRFFAGLRGAPSDDPILPAVLHTVRAFALDVADFERFLEAMAMDLCRSSYATYDDLLGYMEGSAAVIGTMMTPILEANDLARAREHARQLGFAFQLTNFIRDVSEDLDRGRVYLPQEDLDRFGVAHRDLAARQATAAVQELLAFEVARARAHYRAAAPGIELLAPSSRPCIGPPSPSTAASWTRSSGLATRCWEAGCGCHGDAAWPWPPPTGRPPWPPPGPSAGSPWPGLAADKPADFACLRTSAGAWWLGPPRCRGAASRASASCVAEELRPPVAS